MVPPLRPAALFALSLGLAAGPATGHPHIFVDTGFELVFDDEGRLAAVRTAWVYDAFFTLLVVEDGGHDADADGEISAAELDGLRGFDMDWPEGFEGDVEIVQGNARARLGPPEAVTTDWRIGRLISTHLRRFDTPLDPAAGEIVIRPFDPSNYTAYTVVTETRFRGRGDCRAETWEPDLDAAARELQAALAELAPGIDIEEAGYPPVGGLFAEEVRVTCGG